MSDMPTRVKVGGAVYTIDSWDPEHAEDMKRYGETHHMKRMIRVCETLSATRKAETLLHEILHCLQAQWDLDGATDESWIVGIEHGLHAVIVDNPELFDWIVKEMRHGAE